MAAEIPHNETVIADITRLDEYGPFGVTTRVPDLPDLKYHRALATDEDQRRQVFVPHRRLNVVGEGENMVVQVEGTDGSVARTLEPEDIERVWVDHPHGTQMPVDGSSTMMPVIEQHAGAIPVLRWARYAIEFDHHVRIETGRDEELPGIGVYDAYDISGTDSEMTLEEAKEAGTACSRFLVSRVDDRRAVITSRMWYDETRPVIVRPPKHPQNVPLTHVEMVDYNTGVSNEELVVAHREHVKDLEYSAALRFSTDQMALDAIFLYAIND